MSDEPRSAPAEKITRAAFLYFEPDRTGTREEDFAQCGSCRMFVPGTQCIILGSDVHLGPRWSCGFYAPWPNGVRNAEVVANHRAELAKGLKGSVTPEEAGLVNREVRCENCAFFEDETDECELYEQLNKLPLFDLDVKIEEYGCCNAQTPKGKRAPSRTLGQIIYGGDAS